MTVLGTGHKTFVPEKSTGSVEVEITVDDDVTEPVEAAVAFEELTSTQVDKNGEETPSVEQPNEIAEHKDITDEDQTVTSKDSETPGKPSKGKIPWWAILIPGIGLGKIIHDRHHNHDHSTEQSKEQPKDHPKDQSEEHSKKQDSEGQGEHNAPESNGEDKPGDTGQHAGKEHHGSEANGHVPGQTGNPLPSDAGRAEIRSVPSGATQLEAGMQSYIQ